MKMFVETEEKIKFVYWQEKVKKEHEITFIKHILDNPKCKCGWKGKTRELKLKEIHTKLGLDSIACCPKCKTHFKNLTFKDTGKKIIQTIKW